MLAVKQRLGTTPPAWGRLVAKFWGGVSEDRARAFARSLGSQPTVVAGNAVLIDPVERPKRLAVLAYRRGAGVTVLDDLEVVLRASLWFESDRSKGAKVKAKPIPMDAVRGLFVNRMAADDIEFSGEPERGRCTVALRTTDPGSVMRVLAQHAQDIGCKLNVGLHEVDAGVSGTTSAR